MNYQDEEKVVIPSPKELEQIEEIDKTKVFWTVVLAVFIVGFVFVLGYWVGRQKAKTNEWNSLTSVDTVDISGDLNTPPASATTPPPTAQNPTPPPPVSNGNLDTLDDSISNKPKPVPYSSNNGENFIPPSPPTPPSEKPASPVKILPKSSTALTTPKGKWAVRLATVKNQKNAKNLKAKLERQGYKGVKIMKIGVLYRISVLGFPTRERAKRFQDKAAKEFRLTDTIVIKL